MKIADLVGLCKTKGLATHGNKAEVVKRLQEAEEAGEGGGGGDGHNKRAFPGGEEGEENANMEQPAKKPSVQREPEVRVDEGELGLVRIFYSYSIKDQLKSSGFVFDKESASWTFPARLLADRLGLGSCADITAEQVLNLVQEEHQLDYEGIPGESKPPQPVKEQPLIVEVSDGVVRVKGGTYPYKDKIRAAGFKWDPPSYSWTSKEEDISSALLAAGLPGEVSRDSVVAMIETIDPAPAATQADAGAASKPGPKVEIVGDNVVVANSYDLRVQLKKLDFTFDKETKAWTRPTADVLQHLALSDESHITVDALLEAAKEVQNPPPNMSIADNLVKMMTNTYDIRNELRAGGFRWNTDDKVYEMAASDAMSLCGVTSEDELTVDLIVDACKKCYVDQQSSGVTAGGAGTKQEPSLAVEEDMCHVFQSYDVKEKLRALGFRFDSHRSTWSKSTSELVAAVGVASKEELTMENVLEAADKAPPVSNVRVEQGPADALIELDGNEVLVKNSYSIKEECKALDFGWDGERKAWTKSVAEVKILLELEDQNDITVQMLLDKAREKMESNAAAVPGEGVNQAAAQKGMDAYLRSPSPAKQDENPGDQLLSSMGNSHQGWVPTATA